MIGTGKRRCTCTCGSTMEPSEHNEPPVGREASRPIYNQRNVCDQKLQGYEKVSHLGIVRTRVDTLDTCTSKIFISRQLFNYFTHHDDQQQLTLVSFTLKQERYCFKCLRVGTLCNSFEKHTIETMISSFQEVLGNEHLFRAAPMPKLFLTKSVPRRIGRPFGFTIMFKNHSMTKGIWHQ